MTSKSTYKNLLLGIVLFIAIPVGLSAAEIRISGLEVEGNRHFSEREIIKWTGLKIGKSYFESEIFTTLDNILDRLAGEGYYFAQIDSVGKEFYQASRSFRLTIYLEEGERVRLREVEISDSSGAEMPTMERNFPQRKYFLSDDLKRGIEETLSDYENSGYPFVMLELDSLNLYSAEEEKSLIAAFKLESGLEVRLSGVEVKGNRTTRSNVIIREIRIKSGELFTAKSFQRARKYLQKLDLFREVKPLTIIRRGDDFYALAEVKEKRHNSLDGAVGYFPGGEIEEGYWTGLIDIKFNNVFGTGRKFQIHWQQPNRESQDLTLLYREPWIGGLPLDAEAALGQSIRTAAGYTALGGNSKFTTRNASLNGFLPLNETVELIGGINYNEVIPDSLARYMAGIPHSLSRGLSGGFTIDTRDVELNPRSGIYYSSIGKFTQKKNYPDPGTYLPEKVDETGIEAEVEFASRIFSENIFDLRFGGKHLESEQDNIPVSEMYFLGGTNTLRGYREEQFAGTSIFWSKWEYRYIIGMYSRLFIFADYGYFYRREYYEQDNYYEIDGWRLGYGAGFRIETKAGILGVSYGIAEGDSPVQGKLHFSLRNEF